MCGLVAGPIYVVLVAIQALAREGFDITRHPASLLSLGAWGWVQIANFVLTGLLVLALAIGLRRVLTGGRGATWGPILIGIFGLGLIVSGIFRADAMDGFPPGTPAGDPVDVTASGILHLVGGAIGFLALIAACLVFARRFAESGDRLWTSFSIATGAIYFVAFALIGAFSGEAFANLLLTFAVVLGWAWLTALASNYLPPEPAASPAAGSAG